MGGMTIGSRLWAIPEGYIPADSEPELREFESHETACLLNTSTEEARVEITVFFADRDPIGPFVLHVAPMRTLHLRFNDLREPGPIPRGTDYSSVIISNVPIVVQHTRLDSRKGGLALVSTIAFNQEHTG
jgi:hypothetical protein